MDSTYASTVAILRRIFHQAMAPADTIAVDTLRTSREGAAA
jgi:hypothetical protein